MALPKDVIEDIETIFTRCDEALGNNDRTYIPGLIGRINKKLFKGSSYGVSLNCPGIGMTRYNFSEVSGGCGCFDALLSAETKIPLGVVVGVGQGWKTIKKYSPVEKYSININLSDGEGLKKANAIRVHLEAMLPEAA